MDFLRCTAAVVAAGTAFALVPAGVAFAAEKSETRLFSESRPIERVEVPGGSTLTIQVVGGGGAGGYGGAGGGGGGAAHGGSEIPDRAGLGGGAGSSGRGGSSGGYVECAVKIADGGGVVVQVWVGKGGYRIDGPAGGDGGGGGFSFNAGDSMYGRRGEDGEPRRPIPQFRHPEGNPSVVYIGDDLSVSAPGGSRAEDGLPGRGGSGSVPDDEAHPRSPGAGGDAPGGDRPRGVGSCRSGTGNLKPERVKAAPMNHGKTGAANGDARGSEGGFAVGDTHGTPGDPSVPANVEFPATAGRGGNGGESGRGGDGGVGQRDGTIQANSGENGADGGPGLAGNDGAIRLTWTTK